MRGCSEWKARSFDSLFFSSASTFLICFPTQTSDKTRFVVSIRRACNRYLVFPFEAFSLLYFDKGSHVLLGAFFLGGGGGGGVLALAALHSVNFLSLQLQVHTFLIISSLHIAPLDSLQ
jgi:hypothetical protein